MRTTLRTEWLKIKNYMAFKILAVFFGIGVVLTNYIVYSINKNIVHKYKNLRLELLREFSMLQCGNFGFIFGHLALEKVHY